MRAISKIVATAAILTLSAAAQAATWTGTLSGSAKISYFPDNSGAGLPAVQVTGTGTSCTFPATGTATKGASSAAEAEGVRAFYEFLLQAKTNNWNISLEYTASGFCPVSSWVRN